MSGTASLSGDRLLGFYGDDYTGSSAVMEVLSFAGVPTVLFLAPPNEDDLAQFADYRAIGIAGSARSQPPEWMDANLPGIFGSLKALAAPVAHYKICSTFDSSPEIGSIGRAIEIGAPILGGAWHPLLVGAPALGRYQTFGNLFAKADGGVARLDRHPTMARHPVTPMDEADLRRHLARQTGRRSGLIDITELTAGRGDEALERCLAAGDEIVSLDVLDDRSLAEAGRVIWQNRGDRLFAVGSQGVEYALVAHWRDARLLPDRVDPVTITPVERIAIVSASCAPVTAAQIAFAEQAGFVCIPLEAALAVDAPAWEGELNRATARGLAVLQGGRSPLVFTARGPDDAAIARTRAAVAASGLGAGAVNARIGCGLGRLLDRLMREGGIRRGVVAGGDTSSHATQALGVRALTAIAPLAPGAPLCRIHADKPGLRQREIVLKGGQMGGIDFFQTVLGGAEVARAEPRRIYV